PSSGQTMVETGTSAKYHWSSPATPSRTSGFIPECSSTLTQAKGTTPRSAILVSISSPSSGSVLKTKFLGIPHFLRLAACALSTHDSGRYSRQSKNEWPPLEASTKKTPC